MANEVTYHGLTLNQIRDTYYIRFTGNEDRAELSEIASKLSEYWQDVAFYYQDTKRKLNRAKDDLRLTEEQLDYDIEQTQRDYLIEDKGLPKTQRRSDKARETLAIGHHMTRDMRKKLTDLKSEISKIQEEKEIWHEVRQNMRFIADRVKEAQISLAVEAKHTKTYDTPVPTKDYKPEVDIFGGEHGDDNEEEEEQEPILPF